MTPPEAYFQDRDRKLALRASSPFRATILRQQHGLCPDCRQMIQVEEDVELHHREGHHQNNQLGNLVSYLPRAIGRNIMHQNVHLQRRVLHGAWVRLERSAGKWHLVKETAGAGDVNPQRNKLRCKHLRRSLWELPVITETKGNEHEGTLREKRSHCYVTINRAERLNACDFETYEALAQSRFRDDPHCQSVFYRRRRTRLLRRQ